LSRKELEDDGYLAANFSEKRATGNSQVALKETKYDSYTTAVAINTT